jgi:predicted dehydrogenase
MENKKNTAVIGCGVWGKNIVRNFYNLEALHTVCDLDSTNLKKIGEQYPDINLTSNFDEVINNPEIKALCIVTPSHTHFSLVN